MSLPPLPQFKDEYEGEKVRYLVQVLENSMKDFSQVELLSRSIPTVYPQYSVQGNLGSAETTLYKGNVAPARYFNPGWQIKIQAFGTFASNDNPKEIKLYLNNVVIYESTALIINGGVWSIGVMIIVTGASTQQILVTTMSSDISFPSTVIYSAGTVALTGNNMITLTGTGVATNDLLGQAMILTMQPN